MSAGPSRGDVWLLDLDPTRGHEQAGRRPALIVSADSYNRGPARLLAIVPITTTRRGVRWHVPIDPPEGGLRQSSVILCDHVRSLSVERLVARWGTAAPATLAQVEDRLRILFGL